jgi:hypothetical protein
VLSRIKSFLQVFYPITRVRGIPAAYFRSFPAMNELRSGFLMLSVGLLIYVQLDVRLWLSLSATLTRMLGLSY